MVKCILLANIHSILPGVANDAPNLDFEVIATFLNERCTAEHLSINSAPCLEIGFCLAHPAYCETS